MEKEGRAKAEAKGQSQTREEKTEHKAKRNDEENSSRQARSDGASTSGGTQATQQEEKGRGRRQEKRTKRQAVVTSHTHERDPGRTETGAKRKQQNCTARCTQPCNCASNPPRSSPPKRSNLPFCLHSYSSTLSLLLLASSRILPLASVSLASAACISLVVPLYWCRMKCTSLWLWSSSSCAFCSSTLCLSANTDL